jgi:hypothetical protein
MDASQYEINQELEEALFKYEEQRLLQKDISLESFLLSYPALKDQLPKAIQIPNQQAKLSQIKKR